MFQFLNPSILFALSAAVIPIIIHLLNKKKFKEVHFSTIHFLKEMVRKEMRRLRLRQLLLLLLRTLIIILLVLAFARPTLSERNNPLAGRAATEIVIILDNSLSLNSLELTGNLLEQVRQIWFQMEPLFQLNDRISVILGIEPVKILAQREYFSTELWQKIAKEIQPGSMKGNLNLASLKSFEIFQASELPNKELYIVSDFQKSGIKSDELEELSRRMAGVIKTFLIPVFHENDENISIDSVNVLNRLIEKNQTLKIEANLKNHHQKKYLNSMVSLVLNGNRVAQQNLNIPSDSKKSVYFETLLQSTGHVKGFIESENDALLEDNRYYFNLFIPEQIKIMHLVPSATFDSYLLDILKPVIDRKIFLYENTYFSDWSAIQLSQYDIIVLEGFDAIPEGFMNRLEQYQRTGKPIFVIPGSNLSLSNFNKFLKRIKLGQILSLEGQIEMPDKFVPMGKVDWAHPIFEGLFDERQQLNPIHFFSYYRIKPDSDNQAIINLENANILLLEGAGFSYLIACPLNPAWSDILVRGLVVPLIYRIIYYSVTRTFDTREMVEIGGSFSRIFPEVGAPFQFNLKRPSGLESKISPIFKGSDVLLQHEDNTEPGNYLIEQGDEILYVYSVNHSQDESVQEYYSAEQMQSIYDGGIWITDSEKLAEQVELSRYGRELWPYLLGLVLLLLLTELLLGYTSSRKQKDLMNQGLIEISQTS